MRDSIAALLGVSVTLGTGKYLGLPSMVGRSKNLFSTSLKIGCGGE